MPLAFSKLASTSIRKALTNVFILVSKIPRTNPEVLALFKKDETVAILEDIQSAEQAYLWVSSASSQYEAGLRLQSLLSHKSVVTANSTAVKPVSLTIAQSGLTSAFAQGLRASVLNKYLVAGHFNGNSQYCSKLVPLKELGVLPLVSNAQEEALWELKNKHLFQIGHYKLPVIEIGHSLTTKELTEMVKPLFKTQVYSPNANLHYLDKKQKQFVVAVIDQPNNVYFLVYDLCSKQGQLLEASPYTPIYGVSAKEFKGQISQIAKQLWIEMQINAQLF